MLITMVVYDQFLIGSAFDRMTDRQKNFKRRGR